ncbi:MAG: hypothetical protein WCQ69_07390 [Bacteroidales bacterium]|jgi:hypothetical protein
MSDTLGIYRKGMRVLRVFYDPDPLNPRTEFDGVATIACWHRRYNLGDDEHIIELDPSDYDCPGEFIYAILEEYPEIAILLPIYMMDHGNISLRTDVGAFKASDPMGWDWGWVGVVFVTQKDLDKEFNSEEDAIAIMQAEVDVYSDYLSGDVFCVEVMDIDVPNIGDLGASELDALFDEHMANATTYEVCCGLYGDVTTILKDYEFDIDDIVV